MKIQIKIKYACGCEETKEVEPLEVEVMGFGNTTPYRAIAEIELADCADCAYQSGYRVDYGDGSDF